MDKVQNIGDAGNVTAKRKIFKWRYLFFAFFLLCMLWDVGIAVGHPVHTGMTESDSAMLCWKALFAGPYAGRLLPCVPERLSEVGVLELAISAIPLVLMVVMLLLRKVLYGCICFCTFLIFWLGMATGPLCYWK